MTLRIDPLRHRKPEFSGLSWRALRVFDMLLFVSNIFNLNGTLPASFWAPEYLAKEFGLKDTDVGTADVSSWVVNGLSELIRCGTVQKLAGDDSSIIIPDFESYLIEAPKKKSKAATPVPAAAYNADLLMRTWNAYAKDAGLNTVIRLNPERTKRALDVMDEWQEDDIRDALMKIKSSAFLTGNNDRGWKADFDFFIRPGVIGKILEGKYASSGKGAKAPSDVKLVDTSKDLYG